MWLIHVLCLNSRAGNCRGSLQQFQAGQRCREEREEDEVCGVIGLICGFAIGILLRRTLALCA
jgi:hypothetical protein